MCVRANERRKERSPGIDVNDDDGGGKEEGGVPDRRERLREINTTHSNENAGVSSTTGSVGSYRRGSAEIKERTREREEEKKVGYFNQQFTIFMVPLCGSRRERRRGESKIRLVLSSSLQPPRRVLNGFLHPTLKRLSLTATDIKFDLAFVVRE